MALIVTLVENHTPFIYLGAIEDQTNIPLTRDFVVFVNKYGQLGEIKSVHASGDEKEYIIAQFDNLPTAKGYTCFWVGDLANFIAANLS